MGVFPVEGLDGPCLVIMRQPDDIFVLLHCGSGGGDGY